MKLIQLSKQLPSLLSLSHTCQFQLSTQLPSLLSGIPHLPVPTLYTIAITIDRHPTLASSNSLHNCHHYCPVSHTCQFQLSTQLSSLLSGITHLPVPTLYTIVITIVRHPTLASSNSQHNCHHYCPASHTCQFQLSTQLSSLLSGIPHLPVKIILARPSRPPLVHIPSVRPKVK